MENWKKGENLIRLQGVGLVSGTPAINIKEGDILVWNYGLESKVKAIISETPKSKVYALKSSTNDETNSRRLLNTRLVCIKDNQGRF